MYTRRNFMMTTAAVLGSTPVLPFAARADGHGISFAGGAIKVHPVSHASVVFETPAGVIYADPVGEPAAYADKPPADLILVTHEHGDHLNNETLAALVGDNTVLVSNAGAAAKMTADLAAKARVIGNGDMTEFNGMRLDAIPAYNISEQRLKFHPKGRDNGYVMSFADMRVYLSGDTEDIPEMRALEGIDLALICMNLPFTMTVEQAASAVNEFKPGVVIPYHYRGRDVRVPNAGMQNPESFAKLLEAEIVVQQGDWYGAGPGQLPPKT